MPDRLDVPHLFEGRAESEPVQEMNDRRSETGSALSRPATTAKQISSPPRQRAPANRRRAPHARPVTPYRARPIPPIAGGCRIVKPAPGASRPAGPLLPWAFHLRRRAHRDLHRGVGCGMSELRGPTRVGYPHEIEQAGQADERGKRRKAGCYQDRRGRAGAAARVRHSRIPTLPKRRRSSARAVSRSLESRRRRRCVRAARC